MSGAVEIFLWACVIVQLFVVFIMLVHLVWIKEGNGTTVFQLLFALVTLAWVAWLLLTKGGVS